MELKDDKYCFACGADNPIGLKLEFNFTGEGVTVKFTPRREHQGWVNVIHGGILFTLMDEAMARLIINNGCCVVTSSVEVRFLRQAEIDKELTITANINGKEDKIITATSSIVNDRGKTVAYCRGKYIKA